MRQELDAEGQAIRAAVKEAEGRADAEDEDTMSEDDIIIFLEKGGLRGALDDKEVDDEDNDRGLVYDGVFEEAYDPGEYEGLGKGEKGEAKALNWEQRQAAERKRFDILFVSIIDNGPIDLI